MELFIERTGEKKTLSFNGTAENLLKEVGINSEEVIITRNNEIITLDQEVREGDSVRVLSVISGG